MSRRAWIVAAAALIAAGASFVPLPAASADPVGEVWLLPNTGTVDDALRVQTSGPCKRGTAYSVRIAGPGLPKDGTNINGVAELKQVIPGAGGALVVPLSSTFRDFSADNLAGKAMSGRYTMIVRCRDRLSSTSVGDFVGAFTVAKGRYSAEAFPTQPVAAPTPSGSGAAGTSSPTAAPSASSGAPTSSGPTAPSGPLTSSPSAEPPGPAATQSQPPLVAQGTANEAPTAADAQPSPRNVLLIAGALLLLAGGVGYVVSRRRDTDGGAPGAHSSPVDTAIDDDKHTSDV